MWASGSIPLKEKLQKTVFPEGVAYNRKNEAFRTQNVNMVFRSIADLNSIPADNKEGQLNKIVELSNQVGATGFEPATSTPNPAVAGLPGCATPRKRSDKITENQ